MAYGGNCPKCAKEGWIVPLSWVGNINRCLRCGYQREYIEGKGWQVKERVEVR